jgi:hypothetical protein
MVDPQPVDVPVSPYCAGTDKCLTCTAQFAWLDMYTWIQPNGAINFSRARHRPTGLAVAEAEKPPWNRHHSESARAESGARFSNVGLLLSGRRGDGTNERA